MATAALLLLGLLPAKGASGASALIKCRYDPSTRLLSVTASGAGAEALLRRVGDLISVSDSDFLGPPVNCHGSPTVTNTDHIDASARGISSVTIDLSGGPFAPGATPEADSSSEIEFTVGGDGIVNLRGTPGADHFRYMTAEGQSGLDLNPGPEDEDVDLVVRNPETLFVAEGGPGPDTIDVVGRPKVGVFAEGNQGNDTLIAGQGGGGLLGGAILDGGTGRDRIIGSPGIDLIVPGGGADVVDAKGGSDEIDMKPDKSRDQIDCGGGHDKVVKPDPFDRLRSCERVKGRR